MNPPEVSISIEHLSNLGLCVSYDKIPKIEIEIANAVSVKKNVPPNVIPGVHVQFAIDNFDLIKRHNANEHLKTFQF